jgi:hypothetical protein
MIWFSSIKVSLANFSFSNVICFNRAFTALSTLEEHHRKEGEGGEKNEIQAEKNDAKIPSSPFFFMRSPS